MPLMALLFTDPKSVRRLRGRNHSNQHIFTLSTVDEYDD